MGTACYDLTTFQSGQQTCLAEALGATTFNEGGSVDLDGGPWQYFLWSTSEQTEIITVNTTGSYCVTFTDANGCTGSCCIDVTVISTNCQTLPQDFEGNTFPPDCWSITNTYNHPWALSDEAGGFGLSNQSAKMPFLDIDAGSEQLTTPIFASSLANYQIHFDEAYATSEGQNDQLEILTSTDAGENWTQLVLLNGGSSGILNTGGLTTSEFIPTSSQWKTLSYTLPTGTNRVQFNGISAYGNNLYLDNIRIGPACNITTPTITGESHLCQGTASIDAGVGYDTYLWNDDNATTSHDLTVHNPGTYIVLVTNSNGCSATASQTITDNPEVTITSESGTTICNGTEITLSALVDNIPTRYATSVISYSSQFSCCDWGVDRALGEPNVYPNSGDNSEAWASATADDQREYLVLQYNNPAPINFIDIYETFTPGAIDTVYVKNPGTGQFETVYTATAAPATEQARILHITFATTSFNVSQIRIAINSPDVQDFNEIDALGIGATSYSWSPGGATTQSITVTPASTTNYSVTFTDGSGCSVTASQTITVNANATPTITGCPTFSCEGTLDAGSGFASYLWDNQQNSTSQTITVSTSGTYNVTVTATGGCTGTASENVTANPTPKHVSNALSFDGYNDYVQINSDIPGGDEFSFSTWFNATSGTDGKLISSETFEVCVCSGTIQVYTPYDQLNGGNVSLNTWHNITATYNNPNMNVYLDGSLIYTFYTNTSHSIDHPRIGKHYYYDCCQFPGLIDEISFWNVALDNTQRERILSPELTGNETGLTAYYNFNQGTANGTNTGVNTLIDWSGNHHDGTLNNFNLSGNSSNWITGNLGGTNATLNICEGSTKQINDTGTGSNYQSLNNNIATVSNSGLITAVAEGTATITYTLTSSHNCVSTITYTVNVAQLQTPTITGGTSFACSGTIDAGAGYSSYLWSNTASSTTQTIDVVHSGTYIVTVTNTYGCNGTGSATITITDNTPPTITCGGNFSVNNDPGSCTACNPTSTPPTVTSPVTIDYIDRHVTYPNVSLNSGGNSAAVTPGSTVNLNYSYSVAFDGYGGYCTGCIVQVYIGIGGTNTTIQCDNYIYNNSFNSHSVNFTAPSTPGVYYLTQSGSLQLDCVSVGFNNDSANAIGVIKVGGDIYATATDNCGVASITSNAPTCFPLGQTTVTWTAADNNGNSSTCSQIVTVNDNGAIGINCPSNINLNADNGQCSHSNVTYSATLACGTGTLTYYPTSGSTFNVGTTNVLITADDGNGHTSTCSFTVNINNIIPPTITCPADTTVNNTATICGADIIIRNATVIETCSYPNNALNFDGDNDYVSFNSVPQFNSSAFTAEAWIKTTDASGNNEIVVWEDNTGNGAVIEFRARQGKLQLLFFNDNTSEFGFVESNTSVNTGNWTHVAAVKNGTTVSLYVNGVLDNSYVVDINITPNLFLIGNLFIFGGDYGFHGSIDEVRIWNEARTEAQINASMNYLVAPQSTLVANYRFDQGEASGNNTPISQINDNSGHNINGTLHNFTKSGNSSNFVIGATNLKGVTISNDYNGGTTFPLGATNVVWTATDISGNTATCTQHVTVNDNEPPTITCPSDISVCSYVTPTLGSPITVDNCGINSNSISNNAPNVYSIGNNIVTWSVTDIHNNTSTCSQNVTLYPVTNQPVITSTGGYCAGGGNYT